MEIQDCAFPLVTDVVATDDPNVGFKDIDAAFLVGAMPRKEGMERKDLLAANVKIFKVQGEALDKHAKKSVKVLVVGNPANTNALICSHYAPSIPKENFSAMTRLDQNRAAGQLSLKIGEPITSIKKVTIWGNHSSTQFPDASQATVNGEITFHRHNFINSWCSVQASPSVLTHLGFRMNLFQRFKRGGQLSSQQGSLVQQCLLQR